ncbi:hypothetical protein ACOMHN_048217 [Nucella lapillus]
MGWYTGRGASNPEMPQPGGMILPDGTDLRQVTVLSKAEWDRIERELNRRQIEEERVKRIRADQEDQKQRARQIVKTWGNTLAGQRQHKLVARKQREERDEAERLQTDIEEAQYQAVQRRAALDKAKTLQYYQTDRVKTFHGALKLCEVLKEREAQVELKGLREKGKEQEEQEWLLKAHRDYEDSILRDQAAAQKRMDAAHTNRQFLQAQIGDHVGTEEKERAEDQTEGQELKKLAAAYQQEKDRLEAIRRQERHQMMHDNQQQIHDVHKMKQLREVQEEEENEECRVFAAAKRKMTRLRAEKEREIYVHKQEKLDKIQEKLAAQIRLYLSLCSRHKQEKLDKIREKLAAQIRLCLLLHKQEKLDKIREKLAAQMQQALDNEDERIERALQEREEKFVLEERQKEDALRRVLQEQAEQRARQLMEEKAARREELENIQLIALVEEEEKQNIQLIALVEEEERQKAARREELENLQLRKAADEVFRRNELEKEERRHDDGQNRTQFLHQQMDEHKRGVAQVKADQLSLDRANEALMRQEEAQFQEYAGRVMDHCQKRGLNLYPLQRAARRGGGGGQGPVFEGKGGVRPSYMVQDKCGLQLPRYQGVSTDNVKQQIQGQATSKDKLGFVW